jgi:uncharacterized membrane protein YhaH (DUF805 family)
MTAYRSNFIKGRMNRAVFWLCLVMMLVIAVVARLVFNTGHGLSEGILVVFCIPRLHDVGRSGWHVLWGVGVELIVMGLGLAFLPLVLFPLAAGVATLLVLGLLIVLGCLKGDPAANRFGEPPPPGLGSKAKVAA